MTIWNGSLVDATAASALQSIDNLLPPSPDVVLLNYGHGQAATQFADDADALVAGIEARHGHIPVVLILQNPQLDDANVDMRSAGAAWAQDAGVGVIDVAAAFDESDEDLLADAVPQRRRPGAVGPGRRRRVGLKRTQCPCRGPAVAGRPGCAAGRRGRRRGRPA